MRWEGRERVGRYIQGGREGSMDGGMEGVRVGGREGGREGESCGRMDEWTDEGRKGR